MRNPVTSGKNFRGYATVGVSLFSALLFLAPIVANAAFDLNSILGGGQIGAKQSDQQCIPAEPTKCACGTREDSQGKCTIPNRFGCTCVDPRGVTGICDMTDHCQATNAKGQNGGNALDQGMSKLMEQLGKMAEQLMKGGGGGGGGGGSQQPPCSPTQVTADPTIAAANPCQYTYQQSVSNQLTAGGNTTGTNGQTVSDQLLQSLLSATGNQNLTGTGSGTSTSNNTNTSNNSNSSGNQQSVSQTLSNINYQTANTQGGNSQSQNGNSVGSQVVNGTANFSNLAKNATGVQPSVQGNIVVTQSGGTILANGVDTNNNTAISGFYGSDTFGGQVQGVVANLCTSRPWASSFVSVVIPPSFFDGLCQWRGYQTGAAPASTQPQVSLVQSATSKQTTATSTNATSTSAIVGKPQVKIWAVPTSVAVGQRVSIFWNTQNVMNCTETSPDGSFSQSSLSGSAATVPITTATTFTISCLSASSTPVTGFVTVQLAI